MLKSFTNTIRKAFSEAADQYDILTSLHKEIGRELVKKTVRIKADRILDVGCGTGYVANKARFFFPESHIVALDISEGMVAKAKEFHEGIPIDWLQADAQALPFKDQTFDLVLSNLSYQWMRNLKVAFAQAHRVLKPQGHFYQTLFGAKTCAELMESVQAVAGPRYVKPLPSHEQVKEALEMAGFRQYETDYELIKVQFKDVMELLQWLKAIGSNHLSQESFFLGRQMLAKVEDHYRSNFPYHEGICASFEVIWSYGTI